ncbi:MvdC/MvdD family ATP grasp protein [Nonomuraea sp. NBC_00507]|uniref:MvdC/MvdD family ATP grasp protein n=1 Tax=Nonomuraea sp. NBC_00507 TaxID=2976002 RepID=UPI003FA574D4
MKTAARTAPVAASRSRTIPTTDMPPTPQTVLVVTSLIDETANMVIRALRERQVQVARIDPADIETALTFSAHIGNGRDSWGGRLRTPSRDVAIEEIGAAYYRRPSPWRSNAAYEQARKFAITEARHGLRGLLRTLPNCRYGCGGWQGCKRGFLAVKVRSVPGFAVKAGRAREGWEALSPRGWGRSPEPR